MFEDKPNNTSQPASNEGEVPSPPQNLPTQSQSEPPKPLPVKEADPKPTEPVDILADIDKVEPIPVKGPDQGSVDLNTSTPVSIPARQRPITKEPFFKQHKKAFALIIAILVIGVLGTAGWYGYTAWTASSDGPVVEQNLNANTNQATVNQNTNQPTNTNQGIVNQNTNQNPPPAIDSDHDGLNDDEEDMYGTNPQEIDTDQDGLTDRDEVKVFKTDPNNFDTDGDGYGDGDEVRGGYDPKGPGRLLKIE